MPGGRSSVHAYRESLAAFHTSALKLFRKHARWPARWLAPLLYVALQARLRTLLYVHRDRLGPRRLPPSRAFVSRMTDTDVVIVGGGVVGLACAAQLAAAGHSVALIERHPKPGMETSTHNSGVVHAGLYYPAGFAEGAAVRRRGGAALLVLRGAPRAARPLRQAGRRQPTTRKCRWSRRSPRARTPTASRDSSWSAGSSSRRTSRTSTGVAALWSPHTGRVGRRGAGAGAAAGGAGQRRHGARRHRRSSAAGRRAHGFEVRTEHEVITTRVVINAAGLYADELSASLGGERFTIYPCRGEYAELRKARAGWVRTASSIRCRCRRGTVWAST